MSNPQGCRCGNPYYCRCPISRWASSSAFTTAPVTPSRARLGQPDCRQQNHLPAASATPSRLGLASSTPSRFSQSDFHQQTYSTTTPSRLNQLSRFQQIYPGSSNSTGQPIARYGQNSMYSPGYQYYFHPTRYAVPSNNLSYPSVPPASSGPPNSVPFPLSDNATPAVNTAQAPKQTSKRKKNKSASTQPSRKRARVSVPASAPNAPVSITTAAVVGVGPTSAPSVNNAALPINPTVTAIEKVLAKGKPRANRALDVWHFFLPIATNTLEGNESLLRQLQDKETTIPFLTTKPDTPFVGCRLCLAKGWSTPYRNGEGITTTARRHLEDTHGDLYLRVVDELNLRPYTKSSAKDPGPFEMERWIELMVDWIVVDDQSVNLVECPEFRAWVLYGCRNISDRDLPHRTALTNRIYEAYLKDHEQTRKDLQAALGRVSFTSDIWSDPELTPFMALTTHFCARDEAGHLEIAERLLAFRLVEGSHDGENLGQMIYDIVKETGAIHKMGQWTMDNAGNNNTAMEKLERLCAQDGIIFDKFGNRNRCFPHIINIAVQTFVKELKEHPGMVSFPSGDSPVDCFHYETVLRVDPIDKARKTVTALRISKQRREDLQMVITEGNSDHIFEQPIRNVQLLRDVDTRWSALRNMIARFIELYPAIQIMLNRPKYVSLIQNLFTADEWQVLHDILVVLDKAHCAQELLSAEKTPTLSVAMPAFELLLSAWKKLQIEIPELAHFIGVSIAKIQEYVEKGRSSRIYALAMMINPAYKMNWINEHWLTSEVESAKEWILEAMTVYATAQRHKAESDQMTPAANVGTVPRSSGCVASDRLENGLRRMASLQSIQRRKAHLPAMPGSRSSSPALSRTSSPALATTLTTPTALSQPATSTAMTTGNLTPVVEITAAEREVVEREKLRLDRVQAEKQWATYLAAGVVSPEGLNLVRFWDVNERNHPLLFCVALDILPVQASAVPCERLFSSSKITCTDRRNHILPKLLEALQIRKFMVKQQRMDFMEGFLADEADYTIDGKLTANAIEELLKCGNIEELEALLRDAQEAHSDSSSSNNVSC